MGAKRGYDIFPRTFKARLLLALGFAGGPAIIVGSLLLMGLAHRGVDIIVDNRTDGEVSLIIDRDAWGTVGVGSAETFTTYRSSWDGRRLVQVIDETGRMLYSERLSLDDLERMEYRIVIEPP